VSLCSCHHHMCFCCCCNHFACIIEKTFHQKIIKSKLH
jgi:hypothetical protein